VYLVDSSDLREKRDENVQFVSSFFRGILQRAINNCPFQLEQPFWRVLVPFRHKFVAPKSPVLERDRKVVQAAQLALALVLFFSQLEGVGANLQVLFFELNGAGLTKRELSQLRRVLAFLGTRGNGDFDRVQIAGVPHVGSTIRSDCDLPVGGYRVRVTVLHRWFPADQHPSQLSTVGGCQDQM